MSVSLCAGTPVDVRFSEIDVFVEKEDEHDGYESGLPLDEEHNQETQERGDQRDPFVVETEAWSPTG